jgi:hypothetical protein
MTHTELQLLVTTSRARGLTHIHHCRMTGSQRGFPDLVLIGARGIRYRELKVPPDGLTSEQRAIGYRILAAGGDWAVWTPEDWASGLIERELDDIR